MKHGLATPAVVHAVDELADDALYALLEHSRVTELHKDEAVEDDAQPLGEQEIRSSALVFAHPVILGAQAEEGVGA